MRGAAGGEYVELGLNDCALIGIQLSTTWTRYSKTFSEIPSWLSGCATGPRGLQFRGLGGTYYIWGAQTEQSATLGPYIQTDSSTRNGNGGVGRFVTSALGPGTHAISASYSGDPNTAGSGSSAISEVVVQPAAGAPAISSLSPGSGVVGTSVVITGMNFGANQGSSSVVFSGINATVISWSDTSIAFQVPLNATSGNVIVTVNGISSNSVLFTVSSGTGQNATIYSYEIKDGSSNSGYAPNGNVVAYSDWVNGTWSDIGYDSANRLTVATQTVSGFKQYLCWSYDSFGNRLAQTVSGSSCSNPVPTVSYNSNNQIQGLLYDAAGNLTNDGRNQYLYDAEGRVCAVQYQVQPGWPSTMMGYIYDAEGRRVAKGSISQWNCDMDNNGFTETAGYVLGPNGEQMSETDSQANWVHTNVYANGELIATYTPSGLSFHLNDWLGTRRMDTDPFGNPGTTYQSMPFGELLNPAQTITSPEHFFTAKERDSESGLDYFGARHYSSTMGRFLTPDYSNEPEAVPFSDLSNPQSLNLYGYVQNNPLSNVDVDGHSVRCSDGNEATVCVTTNLPDPPGLIFGINLQRVASWTVQAASNTIQNLSNLSHIMNTPGGPNCVGSLVTSGAMAGSGAMALPGLSGIVGGPTVLLSEGSAVLGGGIVGGVAGGTAAMSMCPGAGGGSGAGGSGGSGGSGRSNKVRFGNNANQDYHTFRHVEDAGINRQSAESAIRNDLAGKENSLPQGLTTGEVSVGGKILRYNAFKLQDGTINVGRITVH
nr:RHS repeat-associated core domain-containing protein [Edaphobacter modestus]